MDKTFSQVRYCNCQSIYNTNSWTHNINNLVTGSNLASIIVKRVWQKKKMFSSNLLMIFDISSEICFLMSHFNAVKGKDNFANIYIYGWYARNVRWKIAAIHRPSTKANSPSTKARWTDELSWPGLFNSQLKSVLPCFWTTLYQLRHAMCLLISSSNN